MRPRQGYTLIETLVSLALIATTFAAVTVTLSGMYRSSRTVRDDFRTDMAMRQFAEQFRSDAHEALAASSEGGESAQPSAATLILTMPEGRTARYTLKSQQIERVVRRGDDVVHREAYPITESLEPRWQIDLAGRRPVASLMLAPKPVGSSGRVSSGPTRIDAAIGLSHPPTKPNQP